MFQGISQATRRSYDSAQRGFLQFFYWLQRVNPDGSPLPAGKEALMAYVAYLSRSTKASSIKVYLAAVRSLHIENGLCNPLKDCLRLELTLRRIKRNQVVSKRQRLPVTLNALSKIQAS